MLYVSANLCVYGRNLIRETYGLQLHFLTDTRVRVGNEYSGVVWAGGQRLIDFSVLLLRS